MNLQVDEITLNYKLYYIYFGKGNHCIKQASKQAKQVQEKLC